MWGEAGMRSISRCLFLMLAMSLVLFVLAACNMPTPTPDGPTPGTLPLCLFGDLGQPQAFYPGDYSIILEMSPSFQWEPQTGCNPEGYRIQVTTYGGYDFGELYVGEVDGDETMWSVDTPLDSATDYEWRVAAIAEGEVGPFSESMRFWTGPICDPEALAAPILVAPADGAVIPENYAILDWDDPAPCVPEDYQVELMSAPDFTGTNQMSEEAVGPADEQISFSSLEDCTTYYWRVSASVGATTSPYSEVRSLRTDFTGSCKATDGAPPVATATHTPESGSDFTVTARQNSNCRVGPGTVYAQYGFLLEGESAQATGRLADDTWLVVQLDDRPEPCWIAANLLEFSFPPADLPSIIPPPTPTPALGSIQGLVWHDLCAPPMHTTPSATPLPPPDGCVRLSGGALEGNGVYESGEPGIAGVQVRLGLGSCPSAGLAATTTGSSGGYSFSNLSAGAYCVSADALEAVNTTVLIPGGWTYPARGPVVQTTVTVDPGSTTTGVNFGWDYQFLP